MNKKFLLLPIIGSFMLSGCKFNLFGKTIYLFEKPKDKETIVIPDDQPEDMHQHATSLKQNDDSPNAPFYLKVGEVRSIGVKLDPAPDLDNEKTVRWEIDKSEYVKYTVHETDSKKITIEGLKPGTSVLTATNDYNPTLTYSFTIKVIDFDEENQYLWQYNSEDRKEFGYVYQQVPNGVKEGDACLNGVTWHFIRNKVTSLQSSMGAVGFGKGEEPETSLHFEVDNIRTVKDITIEAASANSQAKMTVKVGETKFMDDVTVEKDYWDVIKTIYSDEDALPSSGKITIDVTTPEFDPKLDGTDGYKKPGAFYLKSILISFKEESEIPTTKTYNFKEMYDDTDSTFYKSLTTSPKTLEVGDEDVAVTLVNVKKETDKVKEHATINGSIDIKVNKPNEVIYKVELKLNFGELSSLNTFVFEKSRSGGLQYFTTTIQNDSTGVLNASLFEDHFNTVRLNTKNNTYVGLVSLKIETLPGKAYTVEGIVVPEVFEPTKKDYVVGDEFSTEGLPNLTIEYKDEGVRPDVLPITDLDWYDGPSYDKDPTKASKTLDLETTKVYGVYQGEIIVTIEGITVIDDPKTLTLVKDASDIDVKYQYYLVAKAAKKVIRGSTGSNMGKTAGMGSLGDKDLGDEITISGAFRNDYFKLEKNESGLFSMQSTTEHFLGMTASGGVSRAANPESNKGTRYFSLTIDAETGLATIKYEITGDNPKVGYLYLKSTTIDMNSEPAANLAFYRTVA